MNLRTLLFWGTTLTLGLGACIPTSSAPPQYAIPLVTYPVSPEEGAASPTPFQPDPAAPGYPAPAALPLPAGTSANPSPPPGALTLWAPATFPVQYPPVLAPAASPESADLRVEPGAEAPLTRQVYALVAAFPTVEDGVSLAEVRAAWEGDGPPLYVSGETVGVFAAWWGPGKGIEAEISGLGTHLWDQRPAWGLVPFGQITPEMKVLAVEGQSPLWKTFDLETYPLAVPFTLVGDPALVEAVRALYPALLPPSNRDPGKLTTVVVTGVTALVRATAFTMEQRGLTYPARDTGAWLREADLTHISNEVPFAEDCPPPNPVQANVVFCSDPRYVALLEEVGTDVVELTGDHFADWGEGAMRFTLGLYAREGWKVYGGGTTYEEGVQAALFEHNGNRIAFIGCNGKRGSFAQASATNPGAVACDMGWLTAEIAQLAAAGYLVIATFQHFEYYNYAAPPGLWPDFRAAAEAGAVVVSGSQAHHPHGFEFVGGRLIHYGLGNLFFDQYGLSPGTEQAFIDRHVFYDGRYLGTELLTIEFEDYARARPMTPAEREALLQAVFAASGW